MDVRCLMEGKRTGVEEYTLGVLRSMMRLAPRHSFILFANSRRPMQLPAFEEPNVEVRAFRFPNVLFNLGLKIAQRPRLDALLGGVDVFFVPSFRLAPVHPSCPLVLTTHDLSFVRHPELFSADRRLWHRFMEPRRLARRAARVLCVSDATARDVERFAHAERGRSRVVHSGIPARMRPLPDGDPDIRRVRARYRLPAHYVLFLGTLEPRKNLESLLSAYTAVRKAGLPHALVLAGARGWIQPTFFTRVRRHPYARDIHVTGFVHDEDKPALYRCASVFVYPSLYEGFGFPPLEALACGTPVVTSFNGALPEVAGRWAQLVNPDDPQELAEVLVDHLRHPLAVPTAISDAIQERYTWERAGRETLAVLEEAAHAHRP